MTGIARATLWLLALPELDERMLAQWTARLGASENARLARFREVRMPFHPERFTKRERQMVDKLVEACQRLELIFWEQSDPDGFILTDRSLSILGRKNGTTRVTAYGEGKKLIGIFDVEVSYDTSMLSAEITRIATQTKFNGAAIVGVGAGAQTFQVGANNGDTLTVTVGCW